MNRLLFLIMRWTTSTTPSGDELLFYFNELKGHRNKIEKCNKL